MPHARPVLLILLALPACLATDLRNPRTREAVARGIASEVDPGGEVTRIFGPPFRFQVNNETRGFGNAWGTWLLRTIRLHTGDGIEQDRHSVRVEAHLHSRGGFRQAYLPNGDPLEVVDSKWQTLLGGQVQEEFGIPLTMEQMRRAAQEPLGITVYGTHGSMVVRLPPYYYEAYVAHLDG